MSGKSTEDGCCALSSVICRLLTSTSAFRSQEMFRSTGRSEEVEGDCVAMIVNLEFLPSCTADRVISFGHCLMTFNSVQSVIVLPTFHTHVQYLFFHIFFLQEIFKNDSIFNRHNVKKCHKFLVLLPFLLLFVSIDGLPVASFCSFV